VSLLYGKLEKRTMSYDGDAAQLWIFFVSMKQQILVTDCKYTRARRRKFVGGLGALNFVRCFFISFLRTGFAGAAPVGTRRLLNGNRLPRRSKVVLSRYAHVLCMCEAKWDLPATDAYIYIYIYIYIYVYTYIRVCQPRVHFHPRCTF